MSVSQFFLVPNHKLLYILVSLYKFNFVVKKIKITEFHTFPGFGTILFNVKLNNRFGWTFILLCFFTTQLIS